MDSEIEDDSSICSYDSDEEYDTQTGGGKSPEEVLTELQQQLFHTSHPNFNKRKESTTKSTNPMHSQLDSTVEVDKELLYHYIACLLCFVDLISFSSDQDSFLKLLGEKGEKSYTQILRTIFCFRQTADGDKVTTIDLTETPDTIETKKYESWNVSYILFYETITAMTLDNALLLKETYKKLQVKSPDDSPLHLKDMDLDDIEEKLSNHKNIVEKIHKLKDVMIQRISIIKTYIEKIEDEPLQLNKTHQPCIHSIKQIIEKCFPLDCRIVYNEDSPHTPIYDNIHTKFKFFKEKNDVFTKDQYNGNIHFDKNTNKILVSWKTHSIQARLKEIHSGEIYDENDLHDFIQEHKIGNLWYYHFNRRISYLFHDDDRPYHIKLYNGNLSTFLKDVKGNLKNQNNCRFEVPLSHNGEIFYDQLTTILKNLRANLMFIVKITNTFASENNYKRFILVRFHYVHNDSKVYNVYTFEIKFYADNSFEKSHEYTKLCKYITESDIAEDSSTPLKKEIIHIFTSIKHQLESVKNSSISLNSDIKQTDNIETLKTSIKELLNGKHRALCIYILEKYGLLPTFNIKSSLIIEDIDDITSKAINMIQHEVCTELISQNLIKPYSTKFENNLKEYHKNRNSFNINTEKILKNILETEKDDSIYHVLTEKGEMIHRKPLITSQESNDSRKEKYFHPLHFKIPHYEPKDPLLNHFNLYKPDYFHVTT